MKEYGILNVVAHPHPEGTYHRIFEALSNVEGGAPFHGDLHAAISKPSRITDGVFTTRLAIWTEVDPNASAIDKRTFVQSLLGEAGVVIPNSIGINSRVFYASFRLSDHKIFIETTNDERKTLSIGRAKKALEALIKKIEVSGIDDISVFSVTQSNAVERVLSIPHIRHVEILLDFPNPDDLSDDESEIIAEMETMNSKRLRTEIVKRAGEDTLVLTERYRVMSGLAKDNGHVTAKGRDGDGDIVERSTKEYPEIASYDPTDGEPSVLAAERVAKQNEK